MQKRLGCTQALFGLCVGVLVSGNLYAAGSGVPVANVPAVAAGRVFETDTLPGRRIPARVVSPASISIVPRVSGEIIEQGFRDGSTVKKGDFLYRLDSVRYEAAQKSAQAELADAQAQYAWAKTALARAKVLLDRNAGSRETYDEAVRTEKTSAAAVEKARAALVLAEDDLNHTTIKAPMDGRVSVAAKVPGDWVVASTDRLVTLVATDPIRVRFAVSLRDVLERFGSLAKLLEEGKVSVTLADGNDLGRTGRVSFADSTAGEDTDTIDLYAEMTNADGALVPGASVAVTLERVSAETYPAVTPSAVSRDEKGAWVWVIREDSTVERRRIVVRAETSTATLVESGLKKGERVVVDGTHKPRENSAVRVIREE